MFTNAEKMFKKLGYELDEQDDYLVYWKKSPNQIINRNFAQNEIQIEFNLYYKTIEKRELFDTDENSNIINLKEWKAINEQIKELGWIK